MAGQRTAYGIPLSLANAQHFADWYYAIRLTPEEEAIWSAALSLIPAPCCEANPVLHCCCQQHGRICNLTHFCPGLGKWLAVFHKYSAEAVRAAVEERLRFLVPNYYLARALEERRLDHGEFGLEPHEAHKACFQGRCEAPLYRGSCGGMGLLVKL